MNPEQLPPPLILLSLADLRDRALAAETLDALAFSMANDSYSLLRFHQALVFAQRHDRLELLCVSGLARPTEDSPYLVWLRRTSRWVGAQLDGEPKWLERASLDLPEDIADGWSEWWPEGVFCVSLRRRAGDQRLGIVLFLLEKPPTAAMQGLLQGVWRTWAYCWHGLARKNNVMQWRPGRRHLILALILAAAAALIPVRQSALAPSEIISREAQIISAPLDGVIATVSVRPNQHVDIGTPLFSLDETTLRNRAEVLSQEVVVANAKLLAASQQAFDDRQSKSELAILTGQMQQSRAELAAVQAQLSRTHVLAPAAGVAVFSDPNDWLGKPVVTGERILLLADPAQLAMRIELPVADAIALEPGAEVTLFLTAYPLQPLHGHVLETSYEAHPTDTGVVAYRLLASIDQAPPHARLGLRGTAKLFGDRVLLGYYLLRRPLASLRAWSGW